MMTINDLVKKIFIMMTVVSLGLFISCKKNNSSDPETQQVFDPSTPQHIKEQYKMVWNDEFDGPELNRDKWHMHNVGQVRHFGTVSDRNAVLNNKGQLEISVTQGNDGKYYIGGISSEKLFEQTYGYFECKARMNKKLGPHVSFWLQSPTISQQNGPAVSGTEIDIFEYKRNTPDFIFHTIHWGGYNEGHQSTGKRIAHPEVQDGYHTFGLEWTENNYIFYVDGKESWRTDSAVSKRSEFPVLTAELSDWGGGPQPGAYPDEVVFEYVRIYKKF